MIQGTRGLREGELPGKRRGMVEDAEVEGEANEVRVPTPLYQLLLIR